MSHSQPIDANCTPPIPQFRALSDQLYQSPDHHEFVREQIINQVFDHINFWFAIASLVYIFFVFSLINHLFQLKTNRDAYDGYVPMAYDDYLEKVARSVPNHQTIFLEWSTE